MDVSKALEPLDVVSIGSKEYEVNDSIVVVFSPDHEKTQMI